jgi:hypothetical protein
LHANSRSQVQEIRSPQGSQPGLCKMVVRNKMKGRGTGMTAGQQGENSAEIATRASRMSRPGGDNPWKDIYIYIYVDEE